MKRAILLAGRTGQVGSELLLLLPELGEVVAPGRRELDSSILKVFGARSARFGRS
jgi:dTDP-4-dehydrorhamnose reductase